MYNNISTEARRRGSGSILCKILMFYVKWQTHLKVGYNKLTLGARNSKAIAITEQSDN